MRLYPFPFRSFVPLVLVALLALALPAVGRAEEPHDDHAAAADVERHAGAAEDDAHEREVVRLSDEVLAEFDIRLEHAGPGRIARSLVLPAEVRPNEDHLAHIAPRFDGIVQEVRSRVGDPVEAGQVLAIVESSQSLAPYPLKTAISGVVISKHVTRGEPVSRETQTFVVADLSDVWIDISVYQKDLDEIRVGQRVSVSAGHGRSEADGVISYLAPIVDEATRTATARIVLPNPGGVWRPGMFVTARVFVDESEVALAVPLSALEIIDGQTVVFVRGDDGFEARAVEVGRQDPEHAELLSGVQVGDEFVSRGGFTLKAELARDELSGGHGH